MLPNVNLNTAIVLLAAISSMIVGSLWYSPILFGEAWMKLSGIPKKNMNRTEKSGMWKLYVAAFIGSLIMAYILGYLILASGAQGILDGIKVSFLVWLGFAMPLLLGGVLWEGKSVQLYILNATYWLISLIVMGLVLSSFT